MIAACSGSTGQTGKDAHRAPTEAVAFLAGMLTVLAERSPVWGVQVRYSRATHTHCVAYEAGTQPCRHHVGMCGVFRYAGHVQLRHVRVYQLAHGTRGLEYCDS